jgi:hypothetical protein
LSIGRIIGGGLTEDQFWVAECMAALSSPDA